MQSTVIIVHQLGANISWAQIDGLVQERRNSIANTIELQYFFLALTYWS